MQGFVFSEFQEYVQRNYGFETWDEIAKKNHVDGKNYGLFKSYPTEELEKLITTLSLQINKPYHDILLNFGLFLSPKFWRITKRMIPSKWSLPDLVENMMGFTNQLLAHAISGTEAPPNLRCIRTGPNEVTVHYHSPRKMCAFGIGIVTGLGPQYDCVVTHVQQHCMHRGDAECEIVFTFTPKKKQPDQ